MSETIIFRWCEYEVTAGRLFLRNLILPLKLLVLLFDTNKLGKYYFVQLPAEKCPISFVNKVESEVTKKWLEINNWVF